MNNREQNRVLIVGCGDVGSTIAQLLLADGYEVTGVRRNVAALPDGISPFAADLTKPEQLDGLADQSFDYVIYIAAAGGFTEELYQLVYLEGLTRVVQLAKRAGWPLKRFFFCSSTSVFGQQDGSWVDETTPLHASHFSGRILAAAEQCLNQSGLPATSVRLGGIYGPGRRRLIDQVKAGHGAVQEPASYTNRIHRDDAAAVFCHLLTKAHQGEVVDDCYVAVDSAPEASYQVRRWLADQLGVEQLSVPSQVVPARSNKRCRNQRLLDSGFCFRYPSYREGYAALIQQIRSEGGL